MHSSRRGVRPAILAYSALSGAARPLALTACVKCLNTHENAGMGRNWRERKSSVSILPSQNRPRLKSVGIAALSCRHITPGLSDNAYRKPTGCE